MAVARCLLSPLSFHGDSSGPSLKWRRSQTEQIHTPPGEERKSDYMTQAVRNHIIAGKKLSGECEA